MWSSRNVCDMLHVVDVWRMSHVYSLHRMSHVVCSMIYAVKTAWKLTSWRQEMYNEHCTMYTVQYTLYIVHCILYIPCDGISHCTVYNMQCTLYTVHCTVYNVHCIFYTVHCILYIIHCILYNEWYDHAVYKEWNEQAQNVTLCHLTVTRHVQPRDTNTWLQYGACITWPRWIQRESYEVWRHAVMQTGEWGDSFVDGIHGNGIGFLWYG